MKMKKDRTRSKRDIDPGMKALIAGYDFVVLRDKRTKNPLGVAFTPYGLQ